MARTAVIAIAEDEVAMACLETLVAGTSNLTVGRKLITRGFGNIKASISKYANASQVIPHVVLTDLDNHACAQSLLDSWGATRLPSTMMLRVAVREVESWVLADRSGFAEFASIPVVKVPTDTDALADPKQALINLCRRSRNHRLAVSIVPEQGSVASIGPRYNDLISGFVRQRWDIEAATAVSASLRRTQERLGEFLVQTTPERRGRNL